MRRATGEEQDGAEEGEGEFDDLPLTHLDDEQYEEFVRRELDAGGRPRNGPPVALAIAVLTLLVFALAVLLLR